MNLPVVILAGSDEVIFGIVRSLKHYQIPIVVITWDKLSIFLFSRFVKKTIKTPNPISDETNFISFLCDYGEKMYQEYGTRILLLPSADISLMLITNHYDELKQYFTMLGDRNEINLWGLRKDIFFKEIKNIGVPMPKTMSCKNERDIEKVAKVMVYPCIVKPAEKDLSFSFYYQYGTKAVVLRNKSELEKFLRENTRTKLLIQEFIPGDTNSDYSWGGYVSKDKNVILGIIGQKLRQIPPGGTTNFAIKRDIKVLEECSRRILLHLGFWGICEIEYKKDPRDGLFKLMEMNPRCWMWFYLATGCGLNLPYIAYREVYYNELPKNIQMKQEMKWVLLKEDFNDAVLKNKDGNFFQKLHYWLRSLEGKKVYAMVDPSDPLVVFAYCAKTSIRGVFRLAQRIIKR